MKKQNLQSLSFFLITNVLLYTPSLYSSSIQYGEWILPNTYHTAQSYKHATYKTNENNITTFTQESWEHRLKKQHTAHTQMTLESSVIHRWQYKHNEYEIKGYVQDYNNAVKITITTKLLQNTQNPT